MKTKLASAVLAISILLAGCGGGGDDGPPAPTNDVFITKADKICAQGEVDLQRKVTATFGNQAPTEDEGVTFTTAETVPLLTAQLEQLRALTPPEGDEGPVNAIWDAIDEGIQTIEGDPEVALGGTDPMADAMELARSYGFLSCGNPSSVPPEGTADDAAPDDTATEQTVTEESATPDS